MPGSMTDVQGPIVFFTGFEGTIKAVHSIFPAVAENLATGLGREDDLPGEVIGRMGFPSACLTFLMIYNPMPFFLASTEWTPIASRTIRKEVPTAHSEFMP